MLSSPFGARLADEDPSSGSRGGPLSTHTGPDCCRSQGMIRPTSVLAPFVLFALPCLGGCNSCDKDKPYVPYTIDPSASGALGALDAAPIDSLAPPPPDKPTESFKPIVAKRLKDSPESTKTAVGTVTAPSGSRIELLLESDVTADGKPDVLAWLRNSGGTAGELVHFASAREGGPLRSTVLAPLPADLTLDTGCKAATDLRQVGPRSVAMTFRRTCGEGQDAIVTEWIGVVVPVRDPAVRLTFLIDQPSEAERLEVQVDGLDRDGDQFDDLLATVRLAAVPKEIEEPAPGDVGVSLHYFDRPAGLSRDPHQPGASFTGIARRLERDAKGKRGESVPPAARQVRRIHSMLCGEAGRPRVRIGGAPLQCGASDAMHRVARAELDALLGAGHLISALGAFDRLQALGAGAKETDAGRKALEKAAPRRETDSYFLPFAPSIPDATVSWGPLAFDAQGSLLIRTDASVMRFDPKTRVAVPDPESGPVSPWAMRVQAPGGKATLESVIDPCDGGLLQARLRRDGSTTSLRLPVDAITTRGCTGGQRPVGVRPVLWSDQGLAMIVAGTSLRVSGDGKKVKRQGLAPGQAPSGGPKSPDGKTTAHASELGVLVVEAGGNAQTWRSASMASGYERLTACTASNGASAVACVDGTRTRVFVPRSD